MAPVSVAVVSWNTRDLLRRCLASLESEHAAGRCSVWVVDNASSDGSAELVRSEFPWVTLVASEENLGFGRAINLVAAQTDAPWLALANADVALRPGALETLLRAGEAGAHAGAVAPRLLLRDGSTQHSVFSFPTIPQALAVSLGLGALFGRRFLMLGHFDAERAQRVPWAVAAFLLVRRAAWDAVGGFDERQWMYAEDLDLGWRLAGAGWTTYFEPAAVVDHESAAATEQAWGDSGKVERWQQETYAWMRRRRGRVRTTAFAAVQALAQGVRWVLLAAAARVAPARYERRREAAHWWLGIHLTGMRSQ
ncbi:MAG: hypothetical protein QOJ29_2635 [Thermoleophilaceae bacterium]|jgi:GT2 family glycosyltransferase|nr:hypothetical protein [Thermoleophilaceae bacterium]